MTDRKWFVVLFVCNAVFFGWGHLWGFRDGYQRGKEAEWRIGGPSTVDQSGTSYTIANDALPIATCTEGLMKWPASKDGSCWAADKPPTP